MKRLAAYMKPYIVFFLIAPVFKAIEASAELLQPKIMTTTVNAGIIAGDTSVIWRNGLLMLGVALVGIAGGIGACWFAAKSSQGFGADLRRAVFQKVQSFSFSDLDRFSTGSLITRLTNDITQLENTSIMMQRIMIRAPLLCIGAIIMTISIQPRLAVVLIATALVLLCAVLFIMGRAFPLFGQVQQRLDAVNTTMQENLAGIRTVKSFVRSDFEVERFDRVNGRFYNTSVAAGRVLSLSQSTVYLGMNIAALVVLWNGGRMVAGREVEIGQIMAIMQYITQILFSLSMLGFLLINLVRARASALRVIEVLDVEPEIRSNSEARCDVRVTRGEVEFRDVTFRYPGAGGDPVLSGIAFHLHPGETLGVLGGTGSGKSTLVHLIPRLYDVTGGQVLVGGVDVRDYVLENLRAGIGMVLQDTVLFSGTIADNLRWGAPDASREDTEKAASEAQAAELALADPFICRMPEGYDSMLTADGGNLSQGQR